MTCEMTHTIADMQGDLVELDQVQALLDARVRALEREDVSESLQTICERLDSLEGSRKDIRRSLQAIEDLLDDVSECFRKYNW